MSRKVEAVGKADHGPPRRIFAPLITALAFHDAFGRMGRIDVAVSNAGYRRFGAAEELTNVQIDLQIATNLIGSIQFIRAAILHLLRQGSGEYVGYHASQWSRDIPYFRAESRCRVFQRRFVKFVLWPG
jgi:NAD(P)-dependent dehydrogenase (short-subunit alcohol dehydrogenase family)